MWKFLLLALLASSNTFAVGQAWLDGQAAGQSVLGRSAGSVTNSNVSNIGSTTNDPATVANLRNTFGTSNAGNVGLGSFGNSKLSTCASYVPNPATPAKNEECEAVNELARNPVAHARSVTGITKSDPMFTNANNMYNLGLNSPAPSTSIGSGTPQSGVTGAGACVQTTSTTPATYTSETCTRSVVPNSKTCTITMNCTVTLPAAVPATPAYSCTGTNVLIGTQCQPVTFAATVNYSCSTGSTLSGTTCQPAPTTATLSYSCVSGTVSGSLCVQPAISATLTYSCPTGSTLSGTSCIPATINASVTYSCAAGTGTLVNTNQCQLPAYQPAGSAATVGHNIQDLLTKCAKGYGAYNGSTYVGASSLAAAGPWAVITTSFPLFWKGYSLTYTSLYSTGTACNSGTIGTWVHLGNASTTYSCPSGYSLSGTTCYPPMVTPPATAATATYSCPAGYNLSGTTCTKPSTTATPNYACPVNYSLSGTNCVTPSTAATASYSCPIGTLSGTSCTQPPVGATVSYTCPTGNTVSGANCQPPSTTAAVTYSCGPGMTLSGSSCTALPILTETFVDTCAQYQTATANPSVMPATAVNGAYTCPAGKTLSGSNCI